MFGRFLISALIFGVGYAMLVYAQKMREIVGTWKWAETLFGIGGTYTGIKLVGVLLMMAAFIYLTNTHELILKNTIMKLILPGQNL